MNQRMNVFIYLRKYKLEKNYFYYNFNLVKRFKFN